MGQFVLNSYTSQQGWQRHGRWKVISMNGVIILYTLHTRKSAFQGDAKNRTPLVGGYLCYQMEQERNRRSYPQGEIQKRKQHIRERMATMLFTECDEWEQAGRIIAPINTERGPDRTSDEAN